MEKKEKGEEVLNKKNCPLSNGVSWSHNRESERKWLSGKSVVWCGVAFGIHEETRLHGAAPCWAELSVYQTDEVNAGLVAGFLGYAFPRMEGGLVGWLVVGLRARIGLGSFKECALCLIILV